MVRDVSGQLSVNVRVVGSSGDPPTMPFEIRAHARYNPAGESRLNIVPGLVGTILTLPPNSLLDPANVPWTGNIIVQMVSFDPRLTNPLPPNPEMRPSVAVDELACKSICRVDPMNMSQA